MMASSILSSAVLLVAVGLFCRTGRYGILGFCAAWTFIVVILGAGTNDYLWIAGTICLLSGLVVCLASIGIRIRNWVPNDRADRILFGGLVLILAGIGMTAVI